jgi:hypothetical protein
MDPLRVGKAVRKIIKLHPGSSGTLEPTVLYEQQGKKKKKQTRILRPLERVTRRVTRARRDYWDAMAEGHDRSNQKKRDGWVRDRASNVVKASRKGSKQLRKIF